MAIIPRISGMCRIHSLFGISFDTHNPKDQHILSQLYGIKPQGLYSSWLSINEDEWSKASRIMCTVHAPYKFRMKIMRSA